MKALNKQALREAAEKALPAMKRLLMMTSDELFDEALLNVDGDVDAANAFSLLSGPETMLALLDELEHYKSREERVTKLVLDNSTSWNELYKQLEAAEKRIAELTGKPAEEYADDGELLFEIDFCDDLSTSIQTAQWLKELRIRRAAGTGVKGE
ncbi:ead/Ea22-like family protein [Escherichia coli]|uniref:ead/Ea22-like family protein n=1 Tax=Citrobacter portucalensis TaxID=1639133 RepID=UPI001581306B|nr:ead/Ea22-like family protein [Citrobacter portucalensis]MBI1679475.1 ead/Ea22-like family protein [Citrobacter portucalensis]NUE67882.1 ead/Ea22-like family protein [Escherichia coli]